MNNREKVIRSGEECLILGIETTCDETAAAVVDSGQKVLSNYVSSQVDLHARYGGVVPEIASRHHLLILNDLIDDALCSAGIDLSQLQAVAVASGPGLVGALLVGVATAKALAYAARLPLIAVNHLEAHLYANRLCGFNIEYPAVALIVSGGHTELLHLTGEGAIKLLGCTRDDAAGEVFDKVARYLKLGYPGGPLIDKLAAGGNPRAINFPRAWLEKENFDFSFSGLKTAVINYCYHQERENKPIDQADLAASFQEALVEVLTVKTLAAVVATGAQTVLIAGGVAANSYLRQCLAEKLTAQAPNTKLYYPPPDLCTDNAAMIAAAAYPLYRAGNFARLDLNARPNLRIGDQP